MSFEHIKQGYDAIYESPEGAFGNRPTRHVEKIPKLIPSGSVLDVGGGLGRNAFFLAEQGLDVTLIDLSSSGIKKVKERSEKEGLVLHAEQRDITKGVDENYDAFIFAYMLHHLAKEQALQLINSAQSHTNDGGVHSITTFTKNGDFYRNNPDTNCFYPTPDELIELYEDWEILEQELSVPEEARAKNADGSHQKNESISILAKKH